MTDDHKPKSSWLRRLGGSPLVRDLGGLIVSAISSAIGALRKNALLLALVGLTGAISYDSLYTMADRVYESAWVPVLYPLQFDVAAIPAFQVAVDRSRPTGQRVFAGIMCVLTVAGSMYGNVVAHFGWAGWPVLLYVSLWPPFAFSTGVLLMHLGAHEDEVEQVVVPEASTSPEVEEPTDTVSDETEVTPTAEPMIGGQKLHAVPLVPEGPWTDPSAPGIRRFIHAWWDLNGREPTTDEVCDHMPAKVREQRSASTQIAQVRRQRAGAVG